MRKGDEPARINVKTVRMDMQTRPGEEEKRIIIERITTITY